MDYIFRICMQQIAILIEINWFKNTFFQITLELYLYFIITRDGQALPILAGEQWTLNIWKPKI